MPKGSRGSLKKLGPGPQNVKPFKIRGKKGNPSTVQGLKRKKEV